RGGLRPVRPVAEHARAGCLPDGPGDLRRHALRHGLRCDRRPLSPGAPSPTCRFVRRCVWPVFHRRPDRGRLHHRHLGLALGLLCQPAGGPNRGADGCRHDAIRAFVPLIYQGVLGVTATNSGQLLTPMMLGLIVASTLVGQAMVRIRYYRFLGTAGVAVMLVGMWLLSQVTVSTPKLEVVRDIVIVG